MTATAPTTLPRARATRTGFTLPRFGSNASFFVIVVVAAMLVLPPLVLMIWTSFTPGGSVTESGAISLGAYRDLVASDSFKDVAWDTAVFTVGASVLALALGSAMAWFVARTNMAGKGLVYACVFFSFAIPGMIEATGWILLFGKGAGIARGPIEDLIGWAPVVQSMPGIIIIQAWSWAPMVFLLLVGPFRAMDASLEESALTSGARRSTVLRRISGPLLAPSIFAVLILVVVRAVQAFEIPLFLGSSAGIRTFTTEIYSSLRKSFRPDYATAAAFGTMLVVVLSLGLYLYHRATKLGSRFATVTGKAFRAREADLGHWRWVAGGVTFLILLGYVAPVLAMVMTSFWPQLGQGDGLGEFTMKNYEQVADYRGIWDGVTNSLYVGVVSATWATLLCLVAAYIIVRTKVRGRQSLDHILSVPMVIPGTVLGLAFLITFLRVPIGIYGTLWILVFAFVAHYAPYSMRYLQPALLQISPDIDDSSRVAGAGTLTVFRRILFPLLMPAIIGSWLYVFFHAFRDVSIASMLYTAATPVVATQLLDMWKDGTAGALSAYGSMLSGASIVIGGLAFWLAKRFGFKL
ncbi:iron ABC transporter permease [Micromonospora sp. NPDC023966]|uniref:ABC transporter permease n=1 Tax=Micromonospora sp. NPDC023966 TaxID=3154699 RepID=UPI0033E73109